MSSVIQDFRKYLSAKGRRLKPSAIRSLQPLLALPDMINLGGGMPDSALFPFTGLSLRVQDASGAEESTLEVSDAELKSALQYGPSWGMPALLRHLKRIHLAYHSPPYCNAALQKESEDADDALRLFVTSGSQAALNKAFHVLLDPGDVVLVENPSYTGSLSALDSLDVHFVGVDVDAHGVDIEALRAACEAHPEARVMYVIETGSNPSGISYSLQRKRELYAVAQQYDLILLADDPYYHLRYTGAHTESTAEDYMSLQTLDTDGRVIRFDSFSKIVSSGLRIGYASGHVGFLEVMQLEQQTDELLTSGVSQMLVLQLLRHWQLDGFRLHIQRVQQHYKMRRDAAVAAAREAFEGKDVEYLVPDAGMFLWIKCNAVEDTTQLIKEGAPKVGVLAVPGAAFFRGDERARRCSFIRVSFSCAPLPRLAQGLKRLASLIDASSNSANDNNEAK